MSFPSQSEQPFGRYEQINEIIGTCLWHVPRGRNRWLPKGSCPLNLAIDIHSLSRILPLVWPASWATTFCKGLRDCMWHVPRATDWSKIVTIVFPPFRRIEKYSPVPIRPAVWVPEAKMLGQTNIIRPIFSSYPPELPTATHQRMFSSIKPLKLKL